MRASAANYRASCRFELFLARAACAPSAGTCLLGAPVGEAVPVGVVRVSLERLFWRNPYVCARTWVPVVYTLVPVLIERPALLGVGRADGRTG